MIFYWDMNGDINLYDDEYLESQQDKDPLLEIALAIEAHGYDGIVIHHKTMKNGKIFFSVNYREDTLEGELYAQIIQNFEKGDWIPTPRGIVKALQKAYEREGIE